MKIEPPLSITGVEITIEPPKSTINEQLPSPDVAGSQSPTLNHHPRPETQDGHAPAWKTFRGRTERVRYIGGAIIGMPST